MSTIQDFEAQLNRDYFSLSQNEAVVIIVSKRQVALLTQGDERKNHND